MAALGTWDCSLVVHVTYLVVLAALGTWWGVRHFKRAKGVAP